MVVGKGTCWENKEVVLMFRGITILPLSVICMETHKIARSKSFCNSLRYVRCFSPDCGKVFAYFNAKSILFIFGSK